MSVPIMIGQTLKDYYIPSGGNNKATFYTPSPKTGGTTGMTRTVWYIGFGSRYEILDSKAMNGEPTSIETKFVEVTAGKVLLHKTTSTGLFETNKKRYFDPPLVLLKLPPSTGKSAWSYTEYGGDSYKCTSVFTTVTYNGVSTKAIKLVRKAEFGTYTDYYVYGVGFWSSKIETASGESMVSDKFKSLSFDKEADR